MPKSYPCIIQIPLPFLSVFVQFKVEDQFFFNMLSDHTTTLLIQNAHIVSFYLLKKSFKFRNFFTVVPFDMIWYSSGKPH